jgi:DNA-binding NtrC family response regulator
MVAVVESISMWHKEEDAVLKRILIVEDDPDWQKELSSILSEAGYQCEIAEDYATGLESLRGHCPSTLLLDLQLCKHNTNEEFLGWKLAKQALESSVPIIIVTGHPSVSGARKAFRDYRVIDFLDKEKLDREELERRVSEGVKASQEHSLSLPERERALEKLRERFYKGKSMRPAVRSMKKDN